MTGWESFYVRSPRLYSSNWEPAKIGSPTTPSPGAPYVEEPSPGAPTVEEPSPRAPTVEEPYFKIILFDLEKHTLFEISKN